MHLFLIRHGESFVNLDDWDKGYIDSGLTPLGEQQSERMARWIANNLQADVLYTSTMARALETAVYLTRTTGLAAQPDDRLREFGNCYFDGTPVPPEEMPIRYADFWGTSRPYTRISEQGESWLLFRTRVAAFLEDVVARHGSGEPDTTVLVVCHGGVIDCMTDVIFNTGVYRRVEFAPHNTGITHWQHWSEPEREPWRLHAHNMAYHLIGEAGEWLGAQAILRSASRKAIPAASDPPES